MNDDFLLVSKKILPDYFLSVIQARDLINGEGLSVTEACRKVSISRSTFYKYKDFVFLPPKSISKKVIIAFKTEDFPGVLSSILSTISQSHGNILTISQDMPIHNLAYITMMVGTKEMLGTLDDLVKALGILPHIKKVEVLAYE
jgi:chorismate mutase